MKYYPEGKGSMSPVLYHNPQCSKSRAALALLQERGVAPKVVEYLKTPPDAKTLKTILKALGMPPRALIRKTEAEYKASGADDPTLSDDALIALMVRFPKLIERPIYVVGNHACIGRPPEKVLELC